MDSANQSDPFIGQILDSRYVIEELIARGGMATVYRATDTRLGRTVALKILAGTLVTEPGFVERFVHEARAAAALTHPNVVAVHDQGIWNEFPFLVMEYVSGSTVRDALRQHGPFTSAHALQIVQSVLLGLSAAHDAGFVHRDIKPENILVTPEGHVKVTDFGLARFIHSAPLDSATGAVLLGTMAYLSPEQVQQKQIDQRSDVYSTGIMLFELLTGTVPFSGGAALDVALMHVNQEVPPPSALQPDVPPAVDHVVLTATRKSPNDRFQSARAFHDAVVRASQAVPLAEALTTVLPLAPTVILDQQDLATTQTQNQTVRESASGSTSLARGGLSSDLPSSHVSWRTKILSVLCALVLAVGAVAWYVLTQNRITIPDLHGLSETRATSVLGNIGLKTSVTDTFSETLRIGTVISSSPKALEAVRKGSTVTLRVSKGKERYIVPANVIGVDPNTASETLAALTLTVSNTLAAYSDRIGMGKVVRTVPSVGSQVKRATGITLVLSKGPAPVTIPAITGQTVTSATRTLASVGLKLEVVREIFDDASVAGEIITTNPSSGSLVKKGTTVKVTVSKGPSLVPVPNVVGMPTDAAKAALEAQGFTVLTHNRLGVVVFNSVYSQDPAGGASVPRGSTITIEIV